MKFGLHHASFITSTGRPQDVWPEVRDRAQWLESKGFDYLSVMDHFWQIQGVGAPDEPFLEGWMTLAALAACTQRLALTTMVTGVVYRNPALVVKMATTLDHISGGRAILGLGGAWNQAEYEAYDIGMGNPFPRPAVRLARLREAAQIAKVMWQQPRATYQGKQFMIRDAILEPKPIQRPRPRILIGGGGEKVTLRIVAQEADMCNFGGPGPKAYSRKMDILREHCAQVGRNVAQIERTFFERVVLGPTRARAEEKWRAQGASERNGYRGLVGTPEDVIRLLREYEQVGGQALFAMIVNTDAESFHLLADEVMPAFR